MHVPFSHFHRTHQILPKAQPQCHLLQEALLSLSSDPKLEITSSSPEGLLALPESHLFLLLMELQSVMYPVPH